MLSSIRINPAWDAAVQQTIANINRIAAQGAADRARILSQTSNEIGELIMDSWQTRQESQDRIARSWSQTMRGVGDYLDPSTNTTVELPHGYDSVWSNGVGEYLLATDPLFNPNSDLSTNHNWMQMEAVR